VLPDPLAQRVQRVIRVSRALPVRLGLQVLLASLALKDFPDLQGLLECKVQ
jgi:hypothetical protein